MDLPFRHLTYPDPVQLLGGPSDGRVSTTTEHPMALHVDGSTVADGVPGELSRPDIYLLVFSKSRGGPVYVWRPMLNEHTTDLSDQIPMEND
jgi:hypothetical protein